MSNVFILKDPLYNETTSKINNFTLEWIKWYRFAKIAPKQYKCCRSDIVIVNLHDGVDPYKGYDIHPECKRIFIVHKINYNNIKHLKYATHILYINDIIRQIAEIGGVNKPYTVCPRYPLHDFFGTKFNKLDTVHIGGWFFDDRVQGLHDTIVNLDSKLHKDIQFKYSYVWGGVESRKIQMLNFINEIKSIKRKMVLVELEAPYLINLFNTRTSRYGFIHRNTPSVEEVFDLISDKNERILEYSISESSMLSMYQSSNVDVICNDTIECLPYFKPTVHFTFKDFAVVIDNIIKKLS